MKHEVDLSGMLDSVPKYIPIEQIIELRLKGLSHAKIGKLLGCTPANITGRLKKLEYKIETLPGYKKHRADILAMQGRRYSDAITNKKLKESSAKDLKWMEAVTFDKEMLARGKATSNVHHYVETVEIRKQKEKELEQLETVEAEVVEKGIRLLPERSEDV